MKTNDYEIKWSLNWSEEKNGELYDHYRVGLDHELKRRKTNDGTGDVLYRIYLYRWSSRGWCLSFGIDYVPNNLRLTQWHESLADCWREMLTLGVSEENMEIIESDICGNDTYSDRAPGMLEYFRELCRYQAENPDVPKI